MEPDKIERIERMFRRRYRMKKAVNILISALIVVLGITSLVFIWNCDGDGIMTFRWMTVDGTVFYDIRKKGGSASERKNTA